MAHMPHRPSVDKTKISAEKQGTHKQYTVECRKTPAHSKAYQANSTKDTKCLKHPSDLLLNQRDGMEKTGVKLF